ncbi:putative secreted RxLR effector protein [Phytophthora cinnamomi]|uniref:putative secreted RxLR effector protein n=1 Tax=Phytophthora cinnamomi TaxID=4785 RepID=UPI00355A0289|nr:putative secreted RxLR effector protein [Phytophthora cinnamomi]
MRLSQLLVVVIAATCLFTSEALATATDNQSKVGSTQRRLRSHRTTIADSEERAMTPALTIEEMKALMAEGLNEDAYAIKLGVKDKRDDLTKAGATGLNDFLMTDEYKKLNAYQDFLRNARKVHARAEALEALKKAKANKSKWSSLVKLVRRSHH